MERNYSNVRLFTYISSVILLAFSINVNFDIARHYFAQEAVVQNYIDFVFFDRAWSAIIATTTLLFVYHYFRAKKIVTFLLVIYIFAQVNTIVSINENMIRIYYFILISTGFALFVFLFSLMLVETNVREEMNLALFFSALIIGFLCSELANHFLLSSVNSITLNRMMGFNLLPTSMMIFIFALNSSFSVGKRRQLPDFLVALRFSELEAMIIFSVFFILMSLFEERSLLENKLSLVHFSEDAIWYYFCLVLAALIYPVTYFAKKAPFHELNLICLLTLIACFSFMKLWVGHMIIGFVIWIVIALSLYLLFTGNIMMLFKKFHLKDMFGVLMLYFFIGSIGVYASHISAVNADEILGEQVAASGLSISIVLGTIFVYYLFRFKKDRLYK